MACGRTFPLGCTAYVAAGFAQLLWVAPNLWLIAPFLWGTDNLWLIAPFLWVADNLGLIAFEPGGTID